MNSPATPVSLPHPDARAQITGFPNVSSWAVAGLAALLFIAPFVIPVHRPPQAAFDAEWLAGVLLALLAIALGALYRMRVDLQLPLPLWLIALIVITAVQYVGAQLSYSAQLMLAVIYSFAISSAYWIGRALAKTTFRTRATEAIGTALVIGGLASVAVQFLQVAGAKGLPHWLVFEIADPWSQTRPFGNLGQANLLSTYLVWAMLSALYLSERRVPPWTAGVLLFVLATGVALTRSRMGSLFVLVLVASQWVPWALRPRSVGWRAAFSLGLLAGYGLGALIVSQFLAFQGVGVETALGRFAESSYGIRLVMWTDAVRVSATAPWLGVGFGQYAAAQYWVATPSPYLWATPYVHNIVLQVAAELGWPMALALVGIGAWWFGFRLRERISSPESALAVTALLFIGFHSLIEWPLWSLHFAIPAAIFFALGEPDCSASGCSVSLDGRLLLVTGLAGFLCALPMKLEFDELSEVALRSEAERQIAGKLSDETISRVVALVEASKLRPLSDRLLVGLRSPARVEASEEEIARHRRLLIQGAEPRLVARLVILLARAGQINEATQHYERLSVFGAADLRQYSSMILDAINDIDSRAAPLRELISRAAAANQRYSQ